MVHYLLDEFPNKETYIKFIKCMLCHSDSFSLVYFRYKEQDPLKKSARAVKNALAPLKKFSVRGNQWPSMATLNDNNHIYEIVLYRACLEAETTLLQVNNIFEWDYPQLPMDLCFYRNGYAWFSSSSHEHYADIILENKKEIKEIESLGIKATFHCEFNDERYLFKEDMLKIKIKDLKEAIYLGI